MKHLQVQHSWEHSISRVFGLFPFLAQDELGKWSLCKASEYPTGCYAQLMPVFPAEKVLGSGNGVISYRTMMKMYYKEIEIDTDKYQTLHTYVQRGLGRVCMNEAEYNTNKGNSDSYFYNEKYKDCDQIPPYFNLCMIKQTLEWYAKRRVILVYAKDHPDEVKGQTCCDIADYRSKGGDCVYNFLKKLIQEDRANTIATDYYNDVKATGEYLNTPMLSLNLMLTASENDMGAINSVIEEWVGGREYKKGTLVRYNGVVYEANKNTKGSYNERTFKIEFNPSDFNTVKNGTTDEINITTNTLKGDSLRRMFRRTVPFIDEYGEQKRPENNEDWLFYYRNGQLTNIVRQQDKFGNIDAYQETNRADNLVLYADILHKIEVVEEDSVIGMNEDEQAVTKKVYYLQFTYYQNAHLRAKGQNITKDDDKNELYVYTDFEFVENDKYNNGIVKYVERKILDTSNEEWIECFGDIENGETFNAELFNAYVSGEFDDIRDIRTTTWPEETFTKMHNIRLSFNTEYGRLSCTKNTGLQDVYFDVEVADITYTDQTKYKNMEDYDYAIPDDYSMGTGWQGSENLNVFIERGNGAAFEKHVKLSEISTLTAMEEYANGGFFVMK